MEQVSVIRRGIPKEEGEDHGSERIGGSWDTCEIEDGPRRTCFADPHQRVSRSACGDGGVWMVDDRFLPLDSSRYFLLQTLCLPDIDSSSSKE